MTRHSLILAAIVLVSSAIGIVAYLTRTSPEAPGHWQEPEDGFAPGELPLTDPRVTGLTTYLRGWQGPQVVYTRVGREWEQ